MSHQRHCACNPDPEECMMRQRQRRLGLGTRALATAEGTERIYLGMVYWVLHRTTHSEENLSLELIQSQHQMMNACFNRLNPSIQKVPTTGRYNHASAVGTANIVFLPTDYRDMVDDSADDAVPKADKHIIRVETNQQFQGLSDTLNYMYANGHDPVAGKQNIICTQLQSYLGEALIEGNVCVVMSAAVGGDLKSGSSYSFRLGITAVHEVGHNYSLPHIFTQGSSNFSTNPCIQPFSDIPPQKYPNFDFQLTFNAKGTSEWDGALCNRQRDCKIYEDSKNEFLVQGNTQTLPYSCFACSTEPSCPGAACCSECTTSLYEQACNFLDYGYDENLVMFSKQQVVAMRETLLDPTQTFMTLLESDGGEISLVGVDITENIPVVSIIESDATTKANSPSTETVAGIVIGTVTALVVAFFIIWFYLLK
jgi:hypothetical protein